MCVSPLVAAGVITDQQEKDNQIDNHCLQERSGLPVIYYKSPEMRLNI
jgi:hypothetical protein